MKSHTYCFYFTKTYVKSKHDCFFMWKQFDFAENSVKSHYSLLYFILFHKFSVKLNIHTKIVLFSQIFCQIKTALPTINRDHFCNSDQFGFGFHWINIKNKLLLWNLWTHPLSLIEYGDLILVRIVKPYLTPSLLCGRVWLLSL